MPKVIDFSLEDADSIEEIVDLVRTNFVSPDVIFTSLDRTKFRFVSNGQVENFLWATVDSLFPVKTLVSRQSYTFKIEACFKTETNCVNYGGYCFTGMMISTLNRLCIGIMTVRIGGVNCRAYGVWRWNSSNNTWTVINETSYTASSFESDAILSIRIHFSYNETADRYRCTVDIATNGSDNMLDQDVTDDQLVYAFQNGKWVFGALLRMLDTSANDYYGVEMRKVTVN